MYFRVTVDATRSHANASVVVAGAPYIGVRGIEVGLPVTAQAGDGLSRYEEFVVDGAVGVMATGAALAHGFMREDEGAPHFLMAGEAFLIAPEQAGAREEFLAAGGFDILAMQVVAVGAEHSSLGHGMVMLERKLGSYLGMTLEACLLGLAEDGSFLPAPRLNVETARAVAGLTALDLDGVIVLAGLESDGSVYAEVEVFAFGLMAHGAGVHADVLCARDQYGVCHHLLGGRDGARGHESSRADTEAEDQQGRFGRATRSTIT